MKVIKFMSLGLVLILLLYLFLTKTNFLTVKQVGVNFIGASCVDQQDIVDTVSLTGQNIFLINDKKIQQQIISKYLCIKKVQVERNFPDKLRLILTTRTAMMKLSSYKKSDDISLEQLDASPSTATALIDWSFPESSQSEFLIADDEGFIFEGKEEGNLPMIFLPNANNQIGQRINPQLSFKLVALNEKLKQLKEQGAMENFDIFQVKIVDNYLLINTLPKLVFSLEKDFLKQLASLQLILQKAKIDGKVIRTLDLRFDKPVMIYLLQKK